MRPSVTGLGVNVSRWGAGVVSDAAGDALAVKDTAVARDASGVGSVLEESVEPPGKIKLLELVGFGVWGGKPLLWSGNGDIAESRKKVGYSLFKGHWSLFQGLTLLLSKLLLLMQLLELLPLDQQLLLALALFLKLSFPLPVSPLQFKDPLFLCLILRVCVAGLLIILLSQRGADP